MNPQLLADPGRAPLYEEDFAHIHQTRVADADDDDDQLLNDCYQKFLDHYLDDGIDRVKEGMDQLLAGLHERHTNSSELEWQSYVQVARNHLICKILHEDPFTFRAFDKPRGYAGDAELLDFIYGVDEEHGAPEKTSDLGRKIFQYSVETPVCDAVRYRARWVAEIVDRLALERQRPSILAVASGHLREANLTGALKQRRIGRWVALDSDTYSLQEVQRRYARYGVEAVAGSIRQLLGRRLELTDFDFIYSTGLYDYLQQPVAKRLTERTFDMLRPGGKLLIANFFEGIVGRGYMECFMDWNLIYRSHPEMLDLAMGLNQSQVKDIRLQVEDNRVIVFLIVTKK